MKTYSDYENLTYDYLKNYNFFKAKLKSYTAELKDTEEQIKAITDAKIAKYDKESGGYQWQQVAEIVKYSARNCQRRARTAINKLAINIFGSEACQQGCLFICLNTKYKN